MGEESVENFSTLLPVIAALCVNHWRCVFMSNEMQMCCFVEIRSLCQVSFSPPLVLCQCFISACPVDLNVLLQGTAVWFLLAPLITEDIFPLHI